MKTITKLTLLGAFIAAFATTGAFADDPQLQQRLAEQRARDTKAGNIPTVAVYSDRKGASRTTEEPAPELRYEIHYNANGEAFGVYVRAK
jgi:hypothetical protein